MKFKMKFYGSGVVWDKENNKPLCRFRNGELETEDERVATILHTLGYKSESNGYKNYVQEKKEVKEIEAPQDEIRFEELTFNELKDLAKAKRMTVGHKSKADLIEALREGE